MKTWFLKILSVQYDYLGRSAYGQLYSSEDDAQTFVDDAEKLLQVKAGWHDRISIYLNIKEVIFFNGPAIKRRRGKGQAIKDFGLTWWLTNLP